MAILVILVLAVLWAAVLLPPILRSRNESGGSGGGVSGMGDFLNRLRDGIGSVRGVGSGGGGGRPNDPSFAPMRPIMGPVTPYGVPQGPVNGMGMPVGPVAVPGAMNPMRAAL